MLASPTPALDLWPPKQLTVRLGWPGLAAAAPAAAPIWPAGRRAGLDSSAPYASERERELCARHPPAAALSLPSDWPPPRVGGGGGARAPARCSLHAPITLIESASNARQRRPASSATRKRPSWPGKRRLLLGASAAPRPPQRRRLHCSWARTHTLLRAPSLARQLARRPSAGFFARDASLQFLSRDSQQQRGPSKAFGRLDASHSPARSSGAASVAAASLAVATGGPRKTAARTSERASQPASQRPSGTGSRWPLL